MQFEASKAYKSVIREQANTLDGFIGTPFLLKIS